MKHDVQDDVNACNITCRVTEAGVGLLAGALIVCDVGTACTEQCLHGSSGTCHVGLGAAEQGAAAQLRCTN